MERSTLAVGSLEALASLVDDDALDLAVGADVVVVTTAAAFVSPAACAVRVAATFETRGARVEALMVIDRTSADERYFAERVTAADLVVLVDGSPLHARSVWRDTAVGAAIDGATSLVAIGSVGTVLGDLMIDPRGGAPTTGLGYRGGVVITAPESEEQLVRTRALLGAIEVLVVLGPLGVLERRDGRWRVVRHEGVECTRGLDPVTL